MTNLGKLILTILIVSVVSVMVMCELASINAWQDTKAGHQAELFSRLDDLEFWEIDGKLVVRKTTYY